MTVIPQDPTRPWLAHYSPGIRASLEYSHRTIPQLLSEAAADVPDRPALIFKDAPISYLQLNEQVDRFAAGLLRMGLKKGDRVALMLANSPQFVIAYFAALRAGGVVTATSPIYTAREAGYQWRDCAARFLIIGSELLKVFKDCEATVPSIERVIVTGPKDYFPRRFQRLQTKLAANPPRQRVPGKKELKWNVLLSFGAQCPMVDVDPSSVACLQYTGGTTGASKGAMLTHDNLVINTEQSCHWISNPTGEPERTIAALPLFHIYAMTCLMISGAYLRSTVVLLPRFILKDVLKAVRKYRPTMYQGVPTMYVAFSSAPGVKRYGFESLRICLSGGAPLPREVQEKFQRLSGGKLVEAYGLTEASPVTHINPPDGLIKNGSIGVPITDTDCRIVDLETGTRVLPIGEMGELCVRGPQVMKGYWNKQAETEEVLRDGWLHTGDIARMDEDGYFYICDRKKDLIIVGGFNVYPREVEEVLFEHPDVAEAMVIGVPDAYRGENVKAFLVSKPGVTPSAEAIVSFCRERLAPYKIPRELEFRATLPKSGVGKYLRRALREEVLAHITNPSSPSQDDSSQLLTQKP